jgi:N-acetylmuramoyl-L-alanine amidase
MPYDWDGLTVYSRKDWGVGESQASKDSEPKTQFVIHHSAFRGLSIDTLAEQKACMKAMYDYHTKEHGWSDIGYSYVLFQPTKAGAAGRIFAGRGRHAVPAAQLGHNPGTIAVCVVQLDEAIKDGTVNRLKSIYKRSTCTKVKGHRDFGGTDCPGDTLYAVIPRVAKAKG